MWVPTKPSGPTPKPKNSAGLILSAAKDLCICSCRVPHISHLRCGLPPTPINTHPTPENRMSPFDRRSFVALLGSSLSTLALSPSEAESQPNPPASLANRRPNVVIMICDDIGSGDLGCYGSDLPTPNLDRLASQGMRFTHFNAAHPICSASRSALMTGRYAPRTGTHPVYFPTSTEGMGLDETTIANLLHQQKYRSLCVGKWHLGHMPPYLPTSRGFDSFLGVPYSVDMRPLPLMKDTSILEPETERALLTPRYTQAAVDFIEKSSEKSSAEPFFLYVAYSYPHIPINASPKFKGKSRHGIYGDAVQEIDWSVGEILATLERKGLDQDTLVFFTGDHGPWFQGSTGPRRGRKGTSWEGGFRVPLLARWTGVIPAGVTCSQAASNLDFVPTLASICGTKLPAKPLDGADISALLAGAPKLDHPKPFLYFSGLRGGLDMQCLRLGDWKLRFAQYAHETYVLGNDTGENRMLAKPELYDLHADPGESYNLADDYPNVTTLMLNALAELIPTFPDKVLESWKKLQANPASPFTPAGAAAKPPTYAAGPNHID
jgi:arylsulfatase A